MSALVGKIGEMLVAAELMRLEINVAFPSHDRGVDMLAYRASDFRRVVPIQVKTRSLTCYHFQKSWFQIRGLVLIQVWNVSTKPEFYIFSNLQDVEEALGSKHSISPSWKNQGTYNATTPGNEDRRRMQAHRDQWQRVKRLL